MKCRIINGRRVCKRESHNPFKMWGSWIGAVIGGVLEYTQNYGISKGMFCDPNLRYFVECIPNIGTPPIAKILIISGFIMAGFLLGWGIHSLIRRLK